MTTPCAFPGCPNPKSPKAGQGLCNSHYWQFHKGRELTPLSYRRNVTEPWLREHIDDVDTGECLIWPFGRLQNDGRAAVKWKGRQTLAAPIMCELAHGPKPTPDHESAHSCGKGHEGCVHPGHLRWATHTENLADQLVHGTRVRGEKAHNAKLTENAVRDIRALAGQVSQSKIAARFGIAQSTAGRIVRGKAWSHVI